VSGYAVVRDQPDHEAAGHISNWTKDYLHKAAVACRVSCMSRRARDDSLLNLVGASSRPMPSGRVGEQAMSYSHGVVNGSRQACPHIRPLMPGVGACEARTVGWSQALIGQSARCLLRPRQATACGSADEDLLSHVGR